MALSRLTLRDFRNHAMLEIRPQAQFIALHGSNGAGKTNILEAISLLVPGRGLRRAAMSDMVRDAGDGGFAIVAEVAGNVIGTGVTAEQPERRKVRVNESNAAINSLAEWLSVIWLTPAMDRLFADGAAARRGEYSLERDRRPGAREPLDHRDGAQPTLIPDRLELFLPPG